MSRRVGCDVCPIRCETQDLTSIPVDEVIERYRAASHRWVQRAMPIIADDEFDEMWRLYCIARRHGADGERAMLALIDDDDESVRFGAAWHAMYYKLEIQRSLEVMRAIAGTDSPLSWAASLHLRIWDHQQKWARELELRAHQQELRDRCALDNDEQACRQSTRATLRRPANRVWQFGR